MQDKDQAPELATPGKVRKIADALADYDGPRTARGLPTPKGLQKVLGFEVTAAERNEAIDLTVAESNAIPPEPKAAPDASRIVSYALSAADEAAILKQRREAGVFCWPGEFAAGTVYPAKIVSQEGDVATLRVNLDGRGALGKIRVEAREGEGPGTYSAP